MVVYEVIDGAVQTVATYDNLEAAEEHVVAAASPVARHGSAYVQGELEVKVVEVLTSYLNESGQPTWLYQTYR